MRGMVYAKHGCRAPGNVRGLLEPAARQGGGVRAVVRRGPRARRAGARRLPRGAALRRGRALARGVPDPLGVGRRRRRGRARARAARGAGAAGARPCLAGAGDPVPPVPAPARRERQCDGCGAGTRAHHAARLLGRARRRRGLPLLVRRPGRASGRAARGLRLAPRVRRERQDARAARERASGTGPVGALVGTRGARSAALRRAHADLPRRREPAALRGAGARLCGPAGASAPRLGRALDAGRVPCARVECAPEAGLGEAALSGLRVVELGRGVAAPFCARLLADHGADVIKLEPPEGDPVRGWGPFAGGAPDAERGAPFQFLNAGKRSLVLDLSRADERAQASALIASADALIDDHRAGELRALGLEWPVLAELNPELVMLSLTPFGLTGPYADWQGCDLNAYHLTATGHRYCGARGAAPLEQGTFAAEFFAGYAAAAWGLAALRGRAAVGGGQLLDVACAQVLAALFTGAQNIGAFAQDGAFERRSGTGMSLAAPATILPCKDGHVWLIALETAQWRALVRVLGDPEWARAELFD